ncbi:Outer membrane efflux protein (modular protein) [Desulfamplus magnetovallimortis]|uniref:Outer membrane efflux protein (Modular protein) n=1 Tax=Desulfamplus magnetovallimortis TaxID=1246637 RepID=A0A1W1H857_9BACT|nr:TolC family protein [Desulfamplus magnetovallimortis]SLM28649.1 Outer membrane efflux protein (modular protein) [Desulfamplus magnetovallimortis]
MIFLQNVPKELHHVSEFLKSMIKTLHEDPPCALYGKQENSGNVEIVRDSVALKLPQLKLKNTSLFINSSFVEFFFLIFILFIFLSSSNLYAANDKLAPDDETASKSSSLSLSDGETLTVEDAIKIALVQNPDIGIARDRLNIASEALERTDSLFRPHMSLFTEFSTGDAPSAYLFKSIDQRDLPNDVVFNDPGTFNNIETGVQLHLNIYNGGVDSVAVRVAESDIREKRAMTKQMENRIVSSVIHLFFSVLKANEYIEIARQSVETIKEQLRIMTVRFKGGGVLKSDLLSLEVRLAEAGKDLVHSRNIHATTLTALNVIMGRKPDSDIYLAKSCECPIVFPGSYQEAVVVAMEKRPEMITAREMLQRARLDLKKAWAGYLPRVDLNARWYLDSDDLKFNGSDNNYTAAMIMNWDFYTGQSTESDLLMAGHGIEAAIKNVKKTELNIYQDVKRAYLNHEDAKNRLDVAGRSVEMADESLILVKQRYEGGSESVTRYLEAELARSKSRMNRTAAFYDEKIALSDIAVSMGILSQIWEK